MDSDSSQSSSGYEDGLGRRVLAFDREAGVMLERLSLRPELCAFEKALSARLQVIAGLEDERFAKPRAIEHLFDGRLIVVSEFIGGRRLSDVVDSASEHGIVGGLDAGLGVLLELLPAISRLHDAGLCHGAIAPGRIMITREGQILLLDAIYAEPLERLQLTRKRLWSELRLAFPPTAGLARFDKAADLSQVVMVASSLIVGRALRDDEYPEGIPALRQEIQEIASIRGSKSFADAVDAFFGAALPLPGKKPAKAVASADEAAIDLRKLLRKELGINTCRTALVEFLHQVDNAEAERTAAETTSRAKKETERLVEAQALAQAETERRTRDRAEVEYKERERHEAERQARDATDRKAREEAERKVREEAERKAREEAERKVREEAERKAREEAERKAREEAERKAREEAERKAREEAERKVREEAEHKAREEAKRKAREEAERKAREEAERKAREEAERKAREEAERKAREEAERKAREEAERKAREEAERKAREAAERKAREEAERKAREEAERKAREEAERKAREEAARKAREETERKAREEAERKAREEAARKAREEAERKAREEAERKAREKAEAEKRERERLAKEAREREEEEARARAERERLERDRQARERAEKAERERQERERERRGNGWLVSPDKSAAFEPVAPAEPPAAPSDRPYPIYVPPAEPGGWTPAAPPEPPKIQIAPTASATASPSATPTSAGGPIRLKLRDYEPVAAPARAGFRNDPETTISAAESYTPQPWPEEKRRIPWKLIAAAVVVLAGGYAVWQFAPSKAEPVIEAVKKVVPSAAPPPPAAPPAGEIAVKSEPAGLKVLLDGKAAGESPVTLKNVPTGRHVITLVGDGGTLKRTVRVEPGAGAVVDVTVFSGFVKITVPFVVEIAENGKVLGTSEDAVLLGPGRHFLHLSNKDLNYTAIEQVEVQPGETTQLNLDPRGRANINATPWAEVWIDGEKAGETPLANVPIRLGVREIVLKNPQFPDRKVVLTFKSGTPETVTVDFNKDK